MKDWQPTRIRGVTPVGGRLSCWWDRGMEFYNRRHRHSALDYLSPEAYEQLFYQQELTFA